VAAPVGAAAARVAVLLLDDVLPWGLLVCGVALALLLVPILLPILGFGALLALVSGLSGSPQGGGPVSGGNPTTIAVDQIPADQLALMQQMANSAPCALAWTVLAAVASIESGFGRTADQFSSAGAYGYGQFLEGTWRSYGAGIP
jgi:hypothetical protein